MSTCTIGNNLYISGNPARSPVETLADWCLYAPSSLSMGRNVEWIQSEDDYEARYSDMGCLSQIFCNTAFHMLDVDDIPIEDPSQDCQLTCGTFTLIAGTLAYTVSSIAITPLDILGKCLKFGALEMYPDAKAYNQMTADHLQLLVENDTIPTEIERLKKKLKVLKQQKAIYAHILDLTKNSPSKCISTKFKNVDWTIRPIKENNRILDYEIALPLINAIKFPKTLSELSKKVHAKEARLQELENELSEIENGLKVIREEKKSFEGTVKKNPEAKQLL